MAITTFMNLDLPTVSTTLGPEWATLLNDALETVDAHDHSSGKGTQVKTAGLNINADLGFNNYRAFGLMSTKFSEQGSTLTGSLNALSLFAHSGNLYWVSGSGTAVQLTSGASIIATPSAVTNMDYVPITSDTVLAPSTTNVVMGVDTNAPRNITLPAASSVASGRIFLVKDETGLSETNNITVLPDGTDTIDQAASYVLSSNFGATFLITNGVNNWLII